MKYRIYAKINDESGSSIVVGRMKNCPSIGEEVFLQPALFYKVKRVIWHMEEREGLPLVHIIVEGPRP